MLVGPGATVTHREDDGWVRVVIRVPITKVAAGEGAER
jgi:hypothetical protein